MFPAAFATDYDGTIATEGHVPQDVVDALRTFKATGRLILVTGRLLDELKAVFPALALFDRVIAENGAVLYEPATGRERALAEAPPGAFVAALRARRITPLSIGRVIVASREPHQDAILRLIEELGLDLQVITNKGAVMVLPAGVDKASGLRTALAELHLSPTEVMGAGDAENDHAFLSLCGRSVAVANALESVKAAADIVTTAPRGAGVKEVLEGLKSRDAGGVPGRRRKPAPKDS
ncbi:MAG: HAD family phosphatase [Alphaproteobacteria bacterium]|nr:HAD family phosphatase [Alphaproteobacteria bacterium]